MKNQLHLLAMVLVILLPILACSHNKPMPEKVEQGIIVKFKDETKQAQKNQLETQVGLQQVKRIPELNLTVYRVTSQKTIDEAINVCEGEPFVEYAEPNLKYRTQK